MKIKSKHLTIAIAIFSWIAVLGSLYMGKYGDPIQNLKDVVFFDPTRALIPCELCWYQRIMVYPIAIISTIGIFLKDKKVFYYILPFPIITILIAIYHIYLQANPNVFSPCNIGIPCNEKQVEYLGFITIPVLSLIFSLIVTLLTIAGIKLNLNRK